MTIAESPTGLHVFTSFKGFVKDYYICMSIAEWFIAI
jgi:hypothetical protein